MFYELICRADFSSHKQPVNCKSVKEGGKSYLGGSWSKKIASIDKENK